MCMRTPTEHSPASANSSSACFRGARVQCTDCRMRRNVHFVVPKKSLRILEGDGYGKGGTSALAEYRYGTGTARHLFCATCGVSPFYQPRSNPDGWAVTFQCVDGGTISSVEVRQFDGLNWEAFIAGQGSAIKSFSKSQQQQASPAAGDAGEASTEAAVVKQLATRRPSLVLLWLSSLVEVLATLALPVVLVLLVTRNYQYDRKLWLLPGKPMTGGVGG